MKDIYYHFYKNFLTERFKTNEERYDFVKSSLLGTALDEFRYACNFLTMFDEDTSEGLFQEDTYGVTDLKRIANERVETILGPINFVFIGVILKYGYPSSFENIYKLFSFKYTAIDEVIPEDIKRLVICLFISLAIYTDAQEGVIKSTEDYKKVILDSEDIIYAFSERIKNLRSMNTFLENFWNRDYNKANDYVMFILSIVQRYLETE